MSFCCMNSLETINVDFYYDLYNAMSLNLQASNNNILQILTLTPRQRHALRWNSTPGKNPQINCELFDYERYNDE